MTHPLWVSPGWNSLPATLSLLAAPLNTIRLTPRSPLPPIWEDESLDSQVVSGEQRKDFCALSWNKKNQAWTGLFLIKTNKQNLRYAKKIQMTPAERFCKLKKKKKIEGHDGQLKVYHKRKWRNVKIASCFVFSIKFRNAHSFFIIFATEKLRW